MSAPPETWRAFQAAVASLERLIEIAPGQEPETRQEQLLRVLNTLEIALLDLPDLLGEKDNPRMPERPSVTREQISKAFPEFGYYHAIRPSPPEQNEASDIADAIEDLVEIADDLIWASRYDDTFDWRDGVWEARFSYAHHTGSHLADLRSYIYRLRFFGP
jgi:hypothetical protein